MRTQVMGTYLCGWVHPKKVSCFSLRGSEAPAAISKHRLLPACRQAPLDRNDSLGS